MAEVLVKNLRNPDQVISVNVTIRRMVVMEEDTGDPMWVVSASTLAPNIDEEDEISEIIYRSDNTNLTGDINTLISNLCERVNWDYVSDTSPPVVSEHWPPVDDTNVSVETSITIKVSDAAPSSGIDLSTLNVRVKGFDVTELISLQGDPREYSIQFTPGTKYKSSRAEDND